MDRAAVEASSLPYAFLQDPVSPLPPRGRDLLEQPAALGTSFPIELAYLSAEEPVGGATGATRVLVCGQDPSDLQILKGLSRTLSLDLVVTSDQQWALSCLGAQKTDLVFLDTDHRGVNWAELLRRIKSHDPTDLVPVLLFISSSDPDLRRRGLEAGADDFIVKPLLAEEIRAKIGKYLEGRGWKTRLEAELQKNTARWVQYAEQVGKRAESLQTALKRIIHNLALAVEAREPHTHGHQKRVAELSLAIGRELGLSRDSQDALFTAARIHDLGKIIIPAEILIKPDRLSEKEFDLIKLHPEAGAAIVEDLDFSRPVARMILEHHERMDGSGYPKGLTGDQVLPESCILSVADVVEAVSFYRPYRLPFGTEIALDEIEKNRGVLYEKTAVDACLRLFREKGFRWK